MASRQRKFIFDTAQFVDVLGNCLKTNVTFSLVEGGETLCGCQLAVPIFHYEDKRKTGRFTPC
jgi:hypothetical protein